MRKKVVAIMAGGDSSEYEVSINSAKEVKASLDMSEYESYVVVAHNGVWRCGDSVVDKNDFSTIVAGKKIKFDYAFIIIHGTPGENGLMQGYFDMMGIPYSSCGVLTSAVTFSKYTCKKMLKEYVITAKEIYLTQHDIIEPQTIAMTLGLPLFVKPDASGSSYGVTKVLKAEDITAAIETARKESPNIIIEEFIAGIEVACGIMTIGGKEMILPTTELVSKNDFFDYEAKYTPGMADEITPARISPMAEGKIRQVTLEIYRRLGCKGIVRVDYIVKDNIPYFIEVNTVPGMSSGSIIPKQLKEYGMTMTEALTAVIKETDKQL